MTIKKSNKTYQEGEFVANLLFKGTYHDSKANLSGSVMVCENRAKINDSKCFAVLMDVNDFVWPESIEDMSKAYAINYTGPVHLGIKSTLRSWEYSVWLQQSVQVSAFQKSTSLAGGCFLPYYLTLIEDQIERYP